MTPMPVRIAPIVLAAVVLATGCSAGPATESPTPTFVAPPRVVSVPTMPVPGPSPTIGWERERGSDDLVWVVRKNGRKLGVLAVGHTRGEEAGIDAVFEPTDTLSAAAKSIGVTHFNWYQYVVKDAHPLRDATGEWLRAPYVDPPCGGYGAPDRFWADDIPWYWNETERPGPQQSRKERRHLLDANIWKGSLFMSDAPDGAPGTVLVFRTYLTGVPKQGKSPVFLGGWTWSFRIGESQARVRAVGRLAENEPPPSNYEEILAASSCPI